MSAITNLDPKPWEREGVRCDFLKMQSGWVRDPRPEFDVGDNPILLAVAQSPDEDWLRWLAEPETDDGWYVLNGRHESFSRRQIEHARAVLELIEKEQNA